VQKSKYLGQRSLVKKPAMRRGEPWTPPNLAMPCQPKALSPFRDEKALPVSSSGTSDDIADDIPF
jgi:hypothetical protein